MLKATLNDLSITSADRSVIPDHVLTAIITSLDNCSFVYGIDLVSLLVRLCVKIHYDPLHLCQQFDSGSYTWETRTILLDDDGIHHGLARELAHLFDSEAGPDVNEISALSCPITPIFFRSEYDWFVNSNNRCRLTLVRYISADKSLNGNQININKAFSQITLPSQANTSHELLIGKFAGMLEEYAFWKLLRRGGSMEGVYFDQEIYKNNTYDSCKSRFLRFYETDVDCIIEDYIGKIVCNIESGKQDIFYHSRICGRLNFLKSTLMKISF